MDETPNDHRGMLPERWLSRRAFARTGLGGGLAAALLATASQQDTVAQATPTAEDDVTGAEPADEPGPRRYVLKGGATELEFVSAAAGSPARLDYRDAAISLGLVGEEISDEPNAALGRLVWAIVETVADGYVRYLTLLVPAVNRDEDRLDIPIRTFAILTTHWTSIGGPGLLEGALQTYEVVALEGMAEFAPVEGASSKGGAGSV